MKLFEKVLEKFGIFSKEFEESLDATAQEDREITLKLRETYQQKLGNPKFSTNTARYFINSAEDDIKYPYQKESNENSSPLGEGKKFDTGKLSYTLLPFSAITEVVNILEFGKQKYGRDNWKKVPNAKERYLDACFRHLISYIEGETKDHESGRHHLAHVVCCLLFILWFDLKDKV